MAKNNYASEIYGQINDIYEQNIIRDIKVKQQCRLFQEERIFMIKNIYP